MVYENAAQDQLRFIVAAYDFTITSDPQRIGQILRNLLSNAFKFTDEGYVRLEIYRAKPRAWSSGEYIAIAVKDTGIGIPLDKRKVIFEPFHQGDGTISRKYGGTGFGLSISEHLARLLGGWIDVESQEGEGSAFMLYLPLSPPVPASGFTDAAQNKAMFAGRGVSG
ncbi:hypothetical protein YSY43_15010 [Paenibacillus sp. YSY-4.3]